MGCPCANPPGTSRFKPIKAPRPRSVQTKSVPKTEEVEEEIQIPKKKSTGLTRQQYLDKEYAEINKKMYDNAFKNNHVNILKRKYLSGFLGGTTPK